MSAVEVSSEDSQSCSPSPINAATPISAAIDLSSSEDDHLPTFSSRKRKPSAEVPRQHHHRPLRQLTPRSPSPQPLPDRYTASPSPPAVIVKAEPSDVIVINGDSDDGSTRTWPADFYAVDIISCYTDCDHSRTSAQEVFRNYFPDVPFRRSTFYEHRQRWKAAPQAMRDDAIAKGRTASGLWSVFMRKNPAKHAKTKAANKHLAAARRNGE